MKALPVVMALALVAGLFTLAVPSPAVAQYGYGMHHGMWERGPGSDRGGWNYCPYCGSRLRDGDDNEMGPGMMDPYYDERGMGYGMMGPGYGRHYDDRHDRQYRDYGEIRSKKEAGQVVQRMLHRSRNPNLKVGDVEDKGDFFVADILTRDGSLVDKIEVDKESGRMRSAY
jgi:hypothetical protein